METTPQSPRIDRGGRAIAAADNGSTASCDVKQITITGGCLNNIRMGEREDNSLKVCATHQQHLDLRTVEGPA